MLSNRKRNRRLDCEILSKSPGRQPIGFSTLLFGFAGQKIHPATKKMLHLLNLATPAVREVKGYSRGSVFAAHRVFKWPWRCRQRPCTNQEFARAGNYHNRRAKNLDKRRI